MGRKSQKKVGQQQRRSRCISATLDVCLTCLKGEEWCFAFGEVGHIAPDQPPPWQEVELAPQAQHGGCRDGYFRLVEASSWCPSRHCLCPGEKEEEQPEGSWEAYLSALKALTMCPACGEWGHLVVNCPLLQEKEKAHQFLSPAREREAPLSPVCEGEPHQCPVADGESHQSPVTEGETHQSPVTEGEPHQSPEIGDYLLLLPPPLEGYYLLAIAWGGQLAIAWGCLFTIAWGCRFPITWGCRFAIAQEGLQHAAWGCLLVITRGFVVSSSSSCTARNSVTRAQEKCTFYRLESPTRTLTMEAPKGVEISADAGDFKATCRKEMQLESTEGQIFLNANTIRLGNLPHGTFAASSPGSTGPKQIVYELCVCPNGKLYLSPAGTSSTCQSTSNICLWS
ncbi:UNVERIFIED_CONTAM: hypothetical protein FKN15_003812 [Acipenser sinensis]